MPFQEGAEYHPDDWSTGSQAIFQEVYNREIQKGEDVNYAEVVATRAKKAYTEKFLADHPRLAQIVGKSVDEAVQAIIKLNMGTAVTNLFDGARFTRGQKLLNISKKTKANLGQRAKFNPETGKIDLGEGIGPGVSSRKGIRKQYRFGTVWDNLGSMLQEAFEEGFINFTKPSKRVH